MKTRPAFNAIVHPAHRLQICSFLAAVKEGEFRPLREELGVSDSVLSKQLRILEEAGYVELRKAPVAGKGRVRTWITLTRSGKRALESHIAELHRMTRGALPVA
ncbi:transcriptional regulator [Allokutzneria sp. NRRL B-24872]|uniref:transcriptional regulator n=1 Tax=Allokutzneria sp. NRRL B-24872 TaxID=1137961 RepID=UPI001AEF838A|nr:transcriptional regulator [Allokutzneria sp. NRRL B-24872]